MPRRFAATSRPRRRKGEPASVLAPNAEATEAEREDEREDDRGRGEHEPHPPVMLREETPAVPRTRHGKSRVGDRGGEDERNRLASRVALRLLEAIVVHP